ncbi:MAG: hypothetical protein ACI8XO_005075 [Verrucomicrobiales bacterium]|jgi:hypothetical protein
MMNTNPRIHQPSARSYISSYSSTPTITQSTALWKAIRHREELEKKTEERFEELSKGGLRGRVRLLLADLNPFQRHTE